MAKKKKIQRKPKSQSKPSAKAKTLDDLLPKIQPRHREVHLHAAIVETDDPAQLAELASNKKVRRYLLGRLSDRAALVDPGNVDAFEAALLSTGHTPKIIDGSST